MKKLQTKKSSNPRIANLFNRQEIVELSTYVINDIKAFLVPLFIGKASYQMNPVNFREELFWGPNTQIEYHRIYDVYNDVPVTVFCKPFRKNGTPLWITWTFVSNVSVMLVAFEEHFFMRYANRTGRKLSPDLISNFFFLYQSMPFTRNTSCGTSSEDVVCNIDEGMILGKRIGANIILAKTFVSKNMLFPGQLLQSVNTSNETK